MLKNRFPDQDLISTHVGSMSGIMAFRKGIADLCTTHVLDEYDKVYNINVVNKYVPHRNWLLINIAKRTQGLIVQKGNPKSLSGIKDIAQEAMSFIKSAAAISRCTHGMSLSTNASRNIAAVMAPPRRQAPFLHSIAP